MRSVGSTLGQYVSSAALAVVVAGLFCFGMTFLTDAGRTPTGEVVSGAIRLAQPEPKPPEEQREKPPAEKEKPPELPSREFSTKRQAEAPKPAMNIRIPAFSADMNPLLSGGIAVPTVSGLGGIGFNIDEVDVHPQVLHSIPPEYPYGAKRNRIEGRVVVKMLVNREGRPERLSVHSSEPSGVFDKAALNSAQRWRFKPGRYAGKDVDTWVLIPFNFELS